MLPYLPITGACLIQVNQALQAVVFRLLVSDQYQTTSMGLQEQEENARSQKEVLTSTPIKTEQKGKYDNKQTKFELFGNEGEK